MKKPILILVLATGVLLSNQSYAETRGICGKTESDCSYIIDDNNVLIISGTGEMTSHPWTNDETVRDSITQLVINNGIKSISGYAFEKMSNVTGTLTIPHSVTKIGGSAFSQMSGITGALVIPDSVTQIDGWAFRYMSGITSIEIPNSIKSINGQLFKFVTGVKSLVIPDSVTSISDYALQSMTSLEDLTVPDSVTKIASTAFSGVSLSSITCSEDNLRRYLASQGGFTANAQIMCTNGKCEDVLKNTKYANLISNVVKYVQEIRQPDGSINIYKHGKLIGFKNKRIYTVNEAETLSKPTGNKFKLRYK